MTFDINLLPWREKKREKAKKIFFTSLLASGASAIAIVAMVLWFYSAQIDEQKQRNQFLNTKLDEYGKKVKKIQDIKEIRKNLTKRMEMIKSLQNNRSVVVYIFDVLNEIVPEGLYLTAVSKKGSVLQLKGVTDTNNQISQLMRSINDMKETQWFTGAVLHEIKNRTDAKGNRKNEFRITLTIDPSQAGEDMPKQDN